MKRYLHIKILNYVEVDGNQADEQSSFRKLVWMNHYSKVL